MFNVIDSVLAGNSGTTLKPKAPMQKRGRESPNTALRAHGPNRQERADLSILRAALDFSLPRLRVVWAESMFGE